MIDFLISVLILSWIWVVFDAHDKRIDQLETQVAALESQVAAHGGQVAATTDQPAPLLERMTKAVTGGSN